MIDFGVGLSFTSVNETLFITKSTIESQSAETLGEFLVVRYGTTERTIQFNENVATLDMSDFKTRQRITVTLMHQYPGIEYMYNVDDSLLVEMGKI